MIETASDLHNRSMFKRFVLDRFEDRFGYRPDDWKQVGNTVGFSKEGAPITDGKLYHAYLFKGRKYDNEALILIDLDDRWEHWYMLGGHRALTEDDFGFPIVADTHVKSIIWHFFYR